MVPSARRLSSRRCYEAVRVQSGEASGHWAGVEETIPRTLRLAPGGTKQADGVSI